MSSSDASALDLRDKAQEWLGQEPEKLSETAGSEVQKHDEDWQAFEFTGEKATVFDAAMRFRVASRSDAPLAAILITRDGKMRASIKGIITSADLAKVPALMD